ncbi:MAG: hypothetical protein ACERJ1_15495 [Halodesulfovibrio sp.]|uniref:hypothetical protein n=1 Tax=Halodesulfovibrio sp. TaxID=1912772 RepID=UPI00359CD436
MRNILILLILSLCLTGCADEPFYIAEIGNAGSTTGKHGIARMSIDDVLGGGGGFGYGAISGYPGKFADIGKMGVPKHIEGNWIKIEDDLLKFYKISAQIDSELAEKKIRTIQNYYKNFSNNWAIMQVVVDSERVRVFYTPFCVDTSSDCTPKKNADPNGWVTKSPKDITDIVVLFDGKGKYSPRPFPGTQFDQPRFYPPGYRSASE